MTARISPLIETAIAVEIEAGWAQSAIAEKHLVSLSTVNRVKKRNKAKSGKLREDTIAAAREELMNSLSTDSQKGNIAQLIQEDLAINRLIKAKIFQAVTSIPDNPEDFKEQIQIGRLLSSLATASKLSNDNLLKTLSSADRFAEDSDELPVLIVREMLDEEIAEIRKMQEEDAFELGR